MSNWIHDFEYHVERREGRTYIESMDGTLIYGSVTGDLSDKQCHDVVTILNTAFEKGFAGGERNKVFEIRKALGIKGES